MTRSWLPQGDFARGALTLMTGTTIAQAIPIAISPILTRLYSPEDYGVFALLIAITAFLSAMATARYELAIMLPEDDAEADAILTLSVVIAFGFGVLLLIIAALFRNPLADFLGHPEIAPWFWLVPLSVFVSGVYTALTYWLNRHKDYRRISTNRVLQSGLGGALQLAGGALRSGAAGLILGQFMAQAATAAQLAWRWRRRSKGAAASPLGKGLARQAHRYRNHPLHLLPAHLVGAAAQQVPIFAISALFGPAATGLFALGNRMVLMPTQIIASALGDVYRQQATVAYRERGEFLGLYLKTLGVAAVLALPPTIVLLLFAPDIFSLIFGEDWRVAGEYARILVISSFFQFVFTPVDKGALIVGATRYIAVWHVLRLALLLVVAAAAWVFHLDITWALALFAAVSAIVYGLDGWIEYRLSRPRQS